MTGDASARRNMLIIMSDEHSRKVMNAYGNRHAITPNLDALAASGTRFSNAYCNSPICVPSRASLHTGLYPHQIGYWDNAMPYDGRVRSWGHELQDAGRHVVSIGKLHFRDAEALTGFDDQVLPLHVKEGVGDLSTLLRTDPPPRPGTRQMSAMAGKGETPYWAYDQAVATAASDWLAEPRAPGWTAFVSFVLPHFPLNAPGRFRQMFDRDALPFPVRSADYVPENDTMAKMRGLLNFNDHFEDAAQVREAVANYYALVAALDENVGKVLDALEASGSASGTIVVYASDHGDNLGNRGYWGKSTMWEESVGVPLLIAGPGIEAGRVVETPVSLVDLHPTVLDAAGLATHADRPGKSLLELAITAEDDRAVFAEYHAVGAATGTFMLRKGSHKLIEFAGDEPILYDLAADPDETENLAGDPASAGILETMRTLLREIVDTGSASRQAFADQAALVERMGGEQRVRAVEPIAFTHPGQVGGGSPQPSK